jgi:2-oxoglutarate-Fe(II)-dependent oxygenase superfamily protein
MYTTHTFEWDEKKLDEFARTHRDSYVRAEPFPHIVMDDFFPPEVLEDVLKEFPNRHEQRWQESANVYTQNKFSLQNDWKMPPGIRHFIFQLNAALFLQFLEQLTGIDGLIPDSHLLGGGLHQSERGGKLGVHADFNWHKKLKLDRRINILIYLNKHWKEEYGGHLELWSKDMQRRVHKILPVFNRCVIFNTTDYSFHGHPDPLTCPEDRSRRSIALYYYSNGRPAEEISPAHSTLYKDRPGERVQKPQTWKDTVVKFVPPIVFDIKKRVEMVVGRRRS